MSHLRKRAVQWLERHPIAGPVLAGLVLRCISATLGLGFHARDDYFHVLEPARRWFANPDFVWETSHVPGAGIRSHLVPRLIQGLLELIAALGIENPETTISLIYLATGVYSLLLVPAMAFTARRLLPGQTWRIATWIAAAHFALPYVGTRLMLEAMAMPPLLFGIGLAVSSQLSAVLLGGFFIGLACWLRFQIGIIGLTVAVVIAIVHLRRAGAKPALMSTVALAGGAALAVGLQGLFDWFTTGRFLGPLIANLMLNMCSAAGPDSAACAWVSEQGFKPHPSLSRSGHFVYLGFWLLLSVPPATLVLLPAMTRAARHMAVVSVPFVAFVLVHSWIPHKEDRFMLPALPLFLLLLAAVPDALSTAHGRIWDALRKAWPACKLWLLATNLVVLSVAITSQSQKSQWQAMAALRHDPAVRGVISMGPELPNLLVARPPEALYQRKRPDAGWFAYARRKLEAFGHPPNRFLCFAQDRAAVHILLLAEGFLCEAPKAFNGWWMDRIVYRLNPKHNRRRSPVYLWACERPAMAHNKKPPPNG